MKKADVENLIQQVENLKQSNERLMAYADAIADVMGDAADLADGDGNAFDGFSAESVYFVLLRTLLYKVSHFMDKEEVNEMGYLEID